MGQTKFMTKLSQYPQSDIPSGAELITLEHELDLPDISNFVSKTYPVGIDRMMQLCEEQLPFLNSRPDAAEKRLRDKCTVPFEL
jgi:hypothetical protein